MDSGDIIYGSSDADSDADVSFKSANSNKEGWHESSVVTRRSKSAKKSGGFFPDASVRLESSDADVRRHSSRSRNVTEVRPPVETIEEDGHNFDSEEEEEVLVLETPTTSPVSEHPTSVVTSDKGITWNRSDSDARSNSNPSDSYEAGDEQVTEPIEALEAAVRTLDLDIETQENTNKVADKEKRDKFSPPCQNFGSFTPLSALPPTGSSRRLQATEKLVQAQLTGLEAAATVSQSSSVGLGIATSTPVFPNHRRNIPVEDWNMTSIASTGGRHLNFTRNHDDCDIVDDEKEDSRNTESIKDDSDVQAVSSSDYADESGSDELENLGAVGGAPRRVPSPPSRKAKLSPDIDAITEKFREQNIGNRKPLIQYLDEAPNPFRAKQEAAIPSRVEFLQQHEEFKDDISKAIGKLAKAISAMPLPNADQDIIDFKPSKKLRATLFPHQIYGLKWMLWRESHFPGGGILADEMGLGKTVMSISLILSGEEKDSDAENWLSRTDKKLVPTNATLVVCPVGCMGQWENELKSKAKGLRIVLYHGPSRVKSAALLSQSDVIITSYNTIGSEIPKPDEDPHNRCKSPLLRLNWHRIMLDEGHVIRNPKTHGALAICRLTARHRWVLTGTPVHNKPEDFFSLVKFLQLRPFDDVNVWSHWIGLKSVAAGNLERLHVIGKAVILRRTKDDLKLEGNCEMMAIPSKTVEDVELEFQENEKIIYDHLEEWAKSQFKKFLKAREEKKDTMQHAANTYVAKGRRGKKAGMAEEGGQEEFKFSHFFALITRMRQASVLPFLIRTMLEDDDEEEEDDDESYNVLNDPVNAKNPAFDQGFKSAKIRAVMKDLNNIREAAQKDKRPMDKVIIVSQWTTLLDIIAQHLKKREFTYAYITGKDSAAERTDTMCKFNSNPKRPQVLLLSIAAGGVGLNLVGANHVFFMEPHWNPQLERQAQDRVHRFGQTKPVFIRRYIVKDSIEMRVLKLQAQKLILADGLLNNAKPGKGAGLNMKDMRTLFGL